MSGFGDDWRDYVPPKNRGDGERALPAGVGHRGSSSRAEPAAEPAAGGARKPGRARLTGHKICYVNADATQLVEAADAKRAGLDKKKQEWIRFHSKHEAKRWIWLKGQERAGHVRNLRRQVRFALNVQRPDKLQETIAHWTCDFDYEQKEIITDAGAVWRRVVEDAKGFKTEIYKRSKAHFEAQYGIPVLET